MGRKELLWLENPGQPRYPQYPLYRVINNYEKAKPDPHIKSLRAYLKVARFLVPHKEMNRPMIRHQYLALDNIFISESGEITNMIDWQHCADLPLFLQAEISVLRR